MPCAAGGATKDFIVSLFAKHSDFRYSKDFGTANDITIDYTSLFLSDSAFAVVQAIVTAMRGMFTEDVFLYSASDSLLFSVCGKFPFNASHGDTTKIKGKSCIILEYEVREPHLYNMILNTLNDNKVKIEGGISCVNFVDSPDDFDDRKMTPLFNYKWLVDKNDIFNFRWERNWPNE